MTGYKPLYIKANETGLVQSRVDHILPDDAYPTLENAYVWRERIKRKQGSEKLGRLRRDLTDRPFGVAGASPWTFNIYSQLTSPITGEPDAEIVAGPTGAVIITIDAMPDPIVFTDQGDGILNSPTPDNSGTINYATGDVTLTHTAAPGDTVTITFSYYPGLPSMGICVEEQNNINQERAIFFDTKYAYIQGGFEFQELLPGTTWKGNDLDFFWSTNYWVDKNNFKIFWVTNFSGNMGDPIRYTNGIAGSIWEDFAPQINAAGDTLNQCLCMIPFRGRMVTFNTREGANLAGSINYRQRIRWAAIGNPFTEVSSIVTTVSADAWRDDVIGKGGFLDIPTSEDIVSVGFVRDNVVVFCERSTWQLRYTGRSIQPFQIEKVNTELGAESTFSGVQFDTSIIAIGDKGIVQCDSFKSERIDIKIPDLVYLFNNTNDSAKRIQGIRNFPLRLAYWIYPLDLEKGNEFKYPNRRLVYNYENDSWAIFIDSFTTLGNYQKGDGRRWEDYPPPDESNQWESLNFKWREKIAYTPLIASGNQKGYISILDSSATNDVSLNIKDITGNSTAPTLITCPNHNLEEGQIITIYNVIEGTDPLVNYFNDLNGKHFYVEVGSADTFSLWTYSEETQQFSEPQLNEPGTYLGGGEIAIRDNFRIVSKKFNFLDEGQKIQMGYIDALFNTTAEGEVSLYVYLDYNNDNPINTLPLNSVATTNQPDNFFNVSVPTYEVVKRNNQRTFQRIFCPTRGSFITIEWTLSNAQMISNAQESDVEIQAQVLWIRPAGTQLPTGV